MLGLQIWFVSSAMFEPYHICHDYQNKFTCSIWRNFRSKSAEKKFEMVNSNTILSDNLIAYCLTCKKSDNMLNSKENLTSPYRLSHPLISIH